MHTCMNPVQDTKGRIFVVGVVIVGKDRERILYLLE